MIVNRNSKLSRSACNPVSYTHLDVYKRQLLYFGGLLGQLLHNYQDWQQTGGMAGLAQIQLPSGHISVSYTHLMLSLAYRWAMGMC